MIPVGVSGPPGAFAERRRDSPITIAGWRSPGRPAMRASDTSFTAAARSTRPSSPIQSRTSFSESLRSEALVGAAVAIAELCPKMVSGTHFGRGARACPRTRNVYLTPFSSKPRQTHRVLERIRLPDRLVLAHPQHAGKPHGDAGLVARGALDSLESQLEDQLRLHRAHRAEALERVPADEGVHLADLLVGEAGVGLGEGDELALLPDAECVVGVEARALAVALLRVDEDGVERGRLDLSLPPLPPRPPHPVGRIAALQPRAPRA